jgi:hypothetical protein
MESRLTKDDFKDCLERDLSQYVQDKITGYNFIHEQLSTDEQQFYLSILLHKEENRHILEFRIAGGHRQSEWEKGWKENLDAGTILPKYFGKYNVLRWKQTFVKPISENYEANMLHLIVDWLADKYMRSASFICEFGCGTGHNLQQVRLINNSCLLMGLDWTASSQELIEKIAEDTSDLLLYGRHFDFFNPDYDFNIEDSIIYTVAALEQTGERYTDFLDYLLYYKPKLCIHIEPIAELLNYRNLLDYTSIKYFKKRGYLSGFLTRLRELESKGQAEILLAQRTFIGSLFIEGYSVVVWKPI